MKRLLVQIFGWRNWAVFLYNSFIEHIFVAFYILLITGQYSNDKLVQLLAFYCFSILSTSFGYLLNDLADRELDALHGKSNTFEQDSVLRAFMVVSAVFLASVVFTIPFWGQSAFLALWGIWIFLTYAYSAPPFRLKERGRIGLIVVVLAQRVLPVLLLFAAFRFTDAFDIILLTFYILLRGFASDLNHQLEDYTLDAKTGTGTFVVKEGIEKTRKLFRRILDLERWFQLLVVFRVGWRLQDFYHFPSWWLVLFFSVYGAMFLFAFFRRVRGEDPNPFLTTQKSIFQFLHHPFQNIILPFLLLIPLIVENYYFLTILPLFLFNKKLLRKQTLLQSFPAQLVRQLKFRLFLLF